MPSDLPVPFLGGGKDEIDVLPLYRSTPLLGPIDFAGASRHTLHTAPHKS